MNLQIANTLNIDIENAPDQFQAFLRKHIPDLLTAKVEAPDVSIRFVEKIVDPVWMKVAPFAERIGDNFVYVDKYQNKAVFPIGKLSSSEPLIILVEQTIVPSLFYEIVIRMVIRHRLLSKGISFVHSSGIVVGEEGIIFPAWGGTGKTNMVIQFLRDGADYLGDDLVLTSADGMLFAFPESISMFDYNFNAFPEYKQLLGRKKHGLFRVKQFMAWLDKTSSGMLKQDSLLRATIARMAQLSKSFTTVSMNHTQLSPVSQVAMSARLTKTFFLTKADIPQPEVVEEPAGALATRIAACLDFEHLFHMHYINAFAFAFPEIPIPSLRATYNKELAILDSSFASSRIYHLRIPLTMNSKDLYLFTRETLGL